jgi:hypothetical protein
VQEAFFAIDSDHFVSYCNSDLLPEEKGIKLRLKFTDTVAEAFQKLSEDFHDFHDLIEV